MGGDGGTKAIQRKFMRGYVNPNDETNDKKNIKENQRIRSQTCSISQKPLSEPIVACELGNLFIKEEVLTHLINKTLNANFSHIRGLKDLKTLIFHQNSSSSSLSNDSKYSCPVTGDSFNGSIPFIFVWSTGYVLSERAIRELGIESLQAEYGPFNAIDVIKINPIIDSPDYNILKSNMEIRRHERSLLNRKEKESNNKRKRDLKDQQCEDGEIVNSTENLKLTGSKRNVQGSLVSDINPTVIISSSSSSSSNILPPKKMTNAHSLVKNLVTKSIEKQTETSQVFRGLFHKDHEADKKDRDLFMSVAGIRYTLS